MNHGWKYITSDECFSSITPKSKIEKKYYSEGHLIPIISQEEEFISGYWDNYSDITPHERPIVIFGDHSRVLKYIDFDFVVGADGVKILLPNESIDAKFLYYYLKWKDVPSLGYSRHFKLLKDYNYLCPPIIRQAEIVSELDKINELIGVKRSQLKDLDALARSLFYETFGEPIDNPKGWETEKFGNICELSAGGDKPADTQKEMNAERNIPVYSNGIDNEGLYGYTSEPRITKPSLTISGRGTLGVPFIRKTPYVPIIRLIVAIPTSVVNLSFLYYLVKIMKFGGKGAAIPQLTVPMVKDVVLPVPPLALQQQFAERIEAIEAQKRRVEASIADLKTLLASRMDYWFND